MSLKRLWSRCSADKRKNPGRNVENCWERQIFKMSLTNWRFMHIFEKPEQKNQTAPTQLSFSERSPRCNARKRHPPGLVEWRERGRENNPALSDITPDSLYLYNFMWPLLKKPLHYTVGYKQSAINPLAVSPGGRCVAEAVVLPIMGDSMKLQVLLCGT